jgi:membrane protease YdiL (CAAX protease family)
VAIALCGGTVLAGMLVLGVRQRLEDLQQALLARRSRVVALIAALWSLYLVYCVAAGTAGVQSLTTMAIYLSVPFFLLRNGGNAWFDAITILWLWLPIELGLLHRLLVPATSIADFDVPFAQALAINTGIIAFAAWRRFPGIGYRFELDWKNVSLALLSFGMFAVIAVPLGLTIGFIQYSFDISKLIWAPASFLAIFLFIAVPEELLFRGLILNWFERITAARHLSLMLASVVFGAAHLNNGPMTPNYKYFLLAGIAGAFYGLVWQRTRNIAASAVTHSLVNTAWSVFFR